MKHLYIARSYGENETFRLLCTNEWERPTDFKQRGGYSYNKPRRSQQTNFVTTRAQVTCPACLDILIPKHEGELAKMKESRSKWPPTLPMTLEPEPMNEAFEPLNETPQHKEDFL